MPRQPAWATPTTLAASSVNNTGMQSATLTAQTTPALRVNAASPSPPGEGNSCTVTPCTCFIQDTGGSAAPPRSPSTRVVTTARTRAGAGQSGRITLELVDQA